MSLLRDKVCIVTGAGGGIGSSICRVFARESAHVVIAVDVREGAVEEWKANSSEFDKIIPYVANIDEELEIKTLVQTIRKQYGRIDVLVNAAGIEYNERIGMINRSQMEKMFSTNVYGLIDLMQYTSRIMMRQGQGSIINIASVVGVYGNPGQAVYSATKGAVISLTKSAAKELASYGIRVNAIAPGLTNTRMIRQASEEAINDRINNIALGRIASPEEIAEPVAFLASDKSSYITGHILGVDGGAMM